MFVLTFRVAHCWCAFRTNPIQEIIFLPATDKVPGQPEIIEGFFNLRGTMTPVVRVARLFHLPFQSSLSSPVIVLRGTSGPIGLLVDEVSSVISISDELRRLTAGHTVNEYAEGEFSAEARSIVLLDFEKILLGEEQQRIQQLQAQAARRLAAVEAVR